LICCTAYSQEPRLSESFKEEQVLTLRFNRDINVWKSEGGIFGRGRSCPDCFAINKDRTKLIIEEGPTAMSPRFRLKVFDLKTKKLTASLDAPQTDQMAFLPDGKIIYRDVSIIRKISSDGKTLWDVSDKAVPDTIIQQVDQEKTIYFNLYYKKILDLEWKTDKSNPILGMIIWLFFSINDQGELFISAYGSVLKYSAKGELLGIVPGMGYPATNCLFRLEDVGEMYKIGGRLSVFSDGKKIREVTIPKDRSLLPEFQEKREQFSYIREISGVDANENVYITQVQIAYSTKTDPLSFFDSVVYKFNSTTGALLQKYVLIKSASYGLEARNAAQIMSDGTIYYWKYSDDKMELWKIPPQ
jgi:hypothetical protein